MSSSSYKYIKDINKEDENEKPPIYYAVIEDDFEDFLELINLAANPFYIDRETGETLLDFTKNPKMKKILEDTIMKAENMKISRRYLDRIFTYRDYYKMTGKILEKMFDIENAYFVEILQNNKIICSRCLLEIKNNCIRCKTCNDEYYCSDLCRQLDIFDHTKYCIED